MTDNPDAFRALLALMNRLEEARIAFKMRHSREDAVMIQVNVPGERWEIEFVDYGDEVHLEIERFRSNGVIDDESVLEELFKHASEPVTAENPDAQQNAVA